MSCKSALFLTAAALAVSACNKQDRTNVAVAANHAYEDTKAAAQRTWDDVKAATWDRREDFKASARELGTKMDAQLQDLRTRYANSQANASRQAAMEKLKSSEADYHQKLDALGTATADTWESAKQEAKRAWEKLEAAYQDARSK